MIKNLMFSALLLFSILVNFFLLNTVLMLDQSENKALVETQLLKEHNTYLESLMNGSYADPEKEIMRKQLEICNKN